jgi:hypothetical protein
MSAQPNVIHLHAALDVPVERMAGELLRALVDEVRTAPAQWSKLSEGQQETLIARLRNVVRLEAAKACQLIAQGKVDGARVKIEGLTVKDGAKCTLGLTNEAAHDVIDYVGKPAVLLLISPEQYFAAGDDVKADRDQPQLPLGDAAAPAAATVTPLTADVQVDDEVRFLSASPDGLVRKVRAVHRDVDPPEIEVTGMPERFAIALFELVVTDPIADVEADQVAERAADGEDDEPELEDDATDDDQDDASEDDDESEE